jgi:uncharacterized membrane protein YbhN (UPF0104 family)
MATAAKRLATRCWLSRGVQAVLSVTLIALILRGAGLARVGATLSSAHAWPLAITVLLNGPIFVLYAVRSDAVLIRLGHRVPMRLLLPASVVGSVAGSLTPVGSGDALRAVVLRSYAYVPARYGAVLVLYERTLSPYLMTVGTVVALAYLVLPLPVAVGIAVGAVPLLALPIGAGYLLGRLEARSLWLALGSRSRRMENLHRIAIQLAGLFGDRALNARWCICTGGIFALVTLQTWLVVHSLVNLLTPLQAWVAFGLSQLAAIVSLLPLGVGAGDVSLAALLHHLGTTLNQGAGAAILLRGTVTLPLVIAAGASYFYLLRRAPPAPATAGAKPSPTEPVPRSARSGPVGPDSRARQSLSSSNGGAEPGIKSVSESAGKRDER